MVPQLTSAFTRRTHMFISDWGTQYQSITLNLATQIPRNGGLRQKYHSITRSAQIQVTK